MAYCVICIGDNGYEKATDDEFTDIEQARGFKDSIEEEKEPLIINADLVERAIAVNNQRLSR